ncbi:MAG: GIY-YIG nuclease family protein [Chthoniobacterales bacterium]
MSAQKLEPIFIEINHGIELFNSFLADEFRIAPLNASNSESFSIIANVPWDDQVWPHSDCPGVYVLCAHDENDPSRRGAYIGKASLSNIGNRVWAHLNPHRATNTYRINGFSGESFIIEAIAAIGLRDLRTRAFASALEEFIIASVRDRVYLLNRIANPS